MEQLNNYTDEGIRLLMEYAPKVLLAIIVLIVGWSIINSIVGMMARILQKKEVDPSLTPFLKSVSGVLLKAVLLISVAEMVGVETTSFVAILGAAGLAVGLALQGSLSNFAGGVLILIFKPFKVGNVIEAQGYTGKVHEIQIFTTVLKTFDNKTIIIPNGPLASGNIVNYSTEELRRVDMSFGIGYGDDIDKAKQIILDLIAADDRVLEEPAAPFVRVSELADSSVNFAVRVWCQAVDYWDIYFDMQEKVKKAFDEKGVSIPFPQVDAHIYQK
ncbi:mechanosensitive ion channel domain-containing protein [Rapidithrix thailandica]|uniref:Mechanosensitive ion channel domain-containing protein n=1 Tax=Rapidithrix thailandica TaxID=413964 RepID=A0AAW9S9B9_9BACT